MRTARAVWNACRPLRAFAGDRNGSTAIEYVLVASLVGIVIYSGASSLGWQLAAVFDFVVSELSP